MSRVDYLLRSVRNQWSGARQACPNCGSTGSVVVERKYVVTALRRCGSCRLMYRTPTDPPGLNEKFYNEDYAQGFTTELPSASDLAKLTATNFAGTTRDYAGYIDALRQLGVKPGARLFDFGCSWGYGSFQLRQAGFQVKSYEISSPRGSFGADNLGVDLVADFEGFAMGDGRGWADVFFSAHVLEHVPSPSRVIAAARSLLRPGGLFVIFVPNGNEAARTQNPRGWSKVWGEVHPHFLDATFLEREFEQEASIVGASPVDIGPAALAHLSSGRGSHMLSGASIEMFFAAKLG